MRSIASLKTSPPSLRQHALFQRLGVRRFSNLPPPSSNGYTDHHENSLFGSFLKWASAITVGSGLGLLYWTSTSDSDSDSAYFKKPLLSFADWSTAASESVSAFRKLALPESAKYLFGGIWSQYNSNACLLSVFDFLEWLFKFIDLLIVVVVADAYRRKIFFNYEKRIRLRSPPEKVFMIIQSHSRYC